ncbi:phosphatase PAP2 family protein [Paucibacter sp. Y2R2-4]|uniref:phosphatase PAP2 family protein n=1 Tax=Paucibacter sp. Y2R2-4 TaxID=2893553 RepID=UPI0021E3DDDA|nr:phosphatase PAP2 family protein [Paucibacter sp. Y2R2-4]MCV2350579.1 phosphatase PAP2 family protein [Paucibacter sp. Y2R2-4]
MNTLSIFDLLGGVGPKGGVGPYGGVGPRGGVGPFGGVGPRSYSTAGDNDLGSACLVRTQGYLTQGLVDPDPPAPCPGFDAAPWLHYGAAPRAQSLLMEALSGLRVRPDISGSGDKETVLLEQLGEGTQGLAWRPLVSISRPPLPYFIAQARLVDDLLPLREVRIQEIHAQANDALSFLLSAAQLPWHRMPRTLELIESALALQMAVQMRFKQILACPRPHQIRPSLLPMIEVPTHGSLPSGHAGESHLVAALLIHLMQRAQMPKLNAQMLVRMALRIAENRVVAGVHYPVDSLAGRLLGEGVARFLLASVGEVAGPPKLLQFGGGAFEVPASAQPDEALAPWLSPECQETAAANGAPPLPVLSDHARLWDLVCKEWSISSSLNSSTGA